MKRPGSPFSNSTSPGAKVTTSASFPNNPKKSSVIAALRLRLVPLPAIPAPSVELTGAPIRIHHHIHRKADHPERGEHHGNLPPPAHNGSSFGFSRRRIGK